MSCVDGCVNPWPPTVSVSDFEMVRDRGQGGGADSDSSEEEDEVEGEEADSESDQVNYYTICQQIRNYLLDADLQQEFQEILIQKGPEIDFCFK